MARGMLISWGRSLHSAGVINKLGLSLALGGTVSFSFGLLLFATTFRMMTRNGHHWSRLMLGQCALDTLTGFTGALTIFSQLCQIPQSLYFCTLNSWAGRIAHNVLSLTDVWYFAIVLATNLLICFTVADRIYALRSPINYRALDHGRRCRNFVLLALGLGLCSLLALYGIQGTSVTQRTLSSDLFANRGEEIESLCQIQPKPLKYVAAFWWRPGNCSRAFIHPFLEPSYYTLNNILGILIGCASLTLVFYYQRRPVVPAQNINSQQSAQQEHELSVTTAILMEGALAFITSTVTNIYALDTKSGSGQKAAALHILNMLFLGSANSYLLLSLTSRELRSNLFQNRLLIWLMPTFRLVKMSRRNLILSYYAYSGVCCLVSSGIIFSV